MISHEIYPLRFAATIRSRARWILDIGVKDYNGSVQVLLKSRHYSRIMIGFIDFLISPEKENIPITLRTIQTP